MLTYKLNKPKKKGYDFMEQNRIEFLNNRDYKYISSLIEEKIPVLKQIPDFNKKYTNLIDIMDELEKILSNQQKEYFDKIVKLFYETEEYYFALAYSLGVKYAKDLKEL